MTTSAPEFVSGWRVRGQRVPPYRDQWWTAVDPRCPDPTRHVGCRCKEVLTREAAYAYVAAQVKKEAA